MNTIRVDTIKPHTGEIEYSVWNGAQFVREGVVLDWPAAPIPGDVTLDEIAAACAAHAIAQGYLA